MEKQLGARTRQVLDVIYRLGEVSAPQIMEEIREIPSYSAVRSILRALEAKGFVEHRSEGLRHVFRAKVPREEASKHALERVLDTFFGGSAESAIHALLNLSREQGRPLDGEAFAKMIRDAKDEGI
jgi:predicted transcriptional regulator